MYRVGHTTVSFRIICIGERELIAQFDSLRHIREVEVARRDDDNNDNKLILETKFN